MKWSCYLISPVYDPISRVHSLPYQSDNVIAVIARETEAPERHRIVLVSGFWRLRGKGGCVLVREVFVRFVSAFEFACERSDFFYSLMLDYFVLSTDEKMVLQFEWFGLEKKLWIFIIILMYLVCGRYVIR